MDYLLDQALHEKINTNLLPYNTMGACKENNNVLWTNSTLETIFREHNLYKITKGNKILQICKNFRCINPNHLREVSHDIWFKNGLETELLWMDYV